MISQMKNVGAIAWRVRMIKRRTIKLLKETNNKVNKKGGLKKRMIFPLLMVMSMLALGN